VVVVTQVFEQRQALEHTLDEFQHMVATGENAHHHQHAAPQTPFVHKAAKVGRNDPCPCGSGKKFKSCCAKLM
jgi:preprotein translocase subunit SecA